MCGLKSKLIHPEFTDLIKQYDIIGLQETKLDDIDSFEIKGFQIYIVKIEKQSRDIVQAG